jgi:chaperonin cofactor prefoldin
MNKPKSNAIKAELRSYINYLENEIEAYQRDEFRLNKDITTLMSNINKKDLQIGKLKDYIDEIISG